jgi:hypothetical protein
MSTEGTERRMEALRREYESPAWWCIECKTPHYIGTPEDRCDDCGREGTTP